MFDTSMYTVVRGEALRKAKGKEPPSTRGIGENGRPIPIGTHKGGITMPRAISPHKQVEVGKWIALACAKDESRPVLCSVWQQGEYSVAADGYRLHFIKGAIAGAKDWTAGRKSKDAPPDYMSLVNRNGEHRATFSTSEMHRALHVVRPFTLDSSNIVRFEFEGDTCEVLATSAEYGDARATVSVNSNSTFSFALNCKYALEMLSGMGEQTEVRVQNEYKPVYFVSGEREGILMPMHISRY